MAEREQVDTDMDSQILFEGGDGRCLDQPVHAEARKEADVIRHEDMVEAISACACQERSSSVEGAGQHLVISEGADAQATLGHRLDHG